MRERERELALFGKCELLLTRMRYIGRRRSSQSSSVVVVVG